MTIDLGITGLSPATELGRGGSARVFTAWQDDLGRTVAVKVLNSSWDDQVKRRFDRERKAMGQLSTHAGIVDVYATGATGDGSSYLIMPYFQLGSLEDLIVREGPQHWGAATALLASVAATMADAHNLGIIHRDLKPANILRGDDGFPKIADFGISTLIDNRTVTVTSGLTFTPSYSPPEAFTSSAATPQRDVYGLGATLWAVLAGRAPFSEPGERADLQRLIGQVLQEPMGDLRPEVPASINTVIQTATAKNPDDRHANAQEFLTDLGHAIGLAESSGLTQQTVHGSTTAEPYQTMDAEPLGIPPIGQHAIAATPPIPPIPRRPRPAMPQRTVPFVRADDEPSRSRDLGLVLRVALVAALVLAFFGAGAYAVTQRGGTTPTVPTTPSTTAAPSTTTTEAPTTTTTEPSTTTTTATTEVTTTAAAAVVTKKTTTTTMTTTTTSPPPPPCRTWQPDCPAG